MTLLASDGLMNTEIAARLGKHPDTVGRCRKRFLRSGLKGLHDAPRSGRRAQLTACTRGSEPAPRRGDKAASTLFPRKGGRRAPEITLIPEERAHLERIARAATSPRRVAERARMTLLACDGLMNTEIAARLGRHPDTVGRCRKRFLRSGLKGLHDAPRSERRAQLTAGSGGSEPAPRRGVDKVASTTLFPRKGGRRAPEITLLPEERAHLERIGLAATSPRRDAERARMTLLACDGLMNTEIAARLGKHPDTVGRWRMRAFRSGVKGLRDAPRSGRPSHFTAEEKARVLQKAIETPRENGVPITHWSKTSLARLAVEAGIVRAIHPTTVWRWLNKADLKPHLSRLWLKSTDPDFDERMRDVVSVYLSTPQGAKDGDLVYSIDEKTSIQALERKYEDIPMRPGKPTRREHEYIRHGTACLTAAFNVATGEVSGVLTPDRPATVFAAFLEKLFASARGAPKIHVVVDQLNTHWHHEACRVVAEASGCFYDPEKHKTGPQRRAFLTDRNKRVVFHFTPKHASWLNQVEIWFSTLSRKVIGRGSFTSIEDLKSKILEFISYHNRVLAHPYRWTYTGTPCRD